MWILSLFVCYLSPRWENLKCAVSAQIRHERWFCVRKKIATGAKMAKCREIKFVAQCFSAGKKNGKKMRQRQLIRKWI